MPHPLDDVRFTLLASGRFRERFGPGGRDTPASNKKLCLVASDPAFLVELLYGLSLRGDCHYVKYSTAPREGMYLGRCFLTSDQAAAELCQELKGHPRLFVSLQDDDWFNAFREPAVALGSCGVWDDFPEQAGQVAAVLEAAFGRSAEAELVNALRAAHADSISLVAQIPPAQPGREAWPVVGYVALSPVVVEGHAELRGLGLAPLAVSPAYQRRGFGTRLVEAGLRRARALGYAYVVVLGDTRYYARFGFDRAQRTGLSYPAPGADPHFMTLELEAGTLANVAGTVRYHAAFSTLP